MQINKDDLQFSRPSNRKISMTYAAGDTQYFYCVIEDRAEALFESEQHKNKLV